MNKRVEQGAMTRQELLDIATELFAERGYAATSVELVLERAAVSRGSLYYHYKSKEALFEAVLENVEARVAQELTRAAREETHPLRALRAGCVAFLHMARKPEVRQIVLIDAPSVVGWERWREIDARHAFGIMRGAVVALKRRRPGGASDELLAHVLLAALLELAMVVARANKPKVALREAQQALDELLESVWRSG